MNTNEFIESMQSLGTRYMEEYARAMQRYMESLNNISQTGTTPTTGDFSQLSDLQKRYSDFVLVQSPKIITRMSEESISYYSKLADLSFQMLNGYVDSVVTTVNSSTQPGAESTTKNNSNLLFHGLSGGSASNAFLISNNRDTAIDIKFDMLEVSSPDTDQSFKPTAKFTPAKCRLAPFSERVVQCTVQLSEEFKVDQTYDGSIAVAGYPEMAMRISVQVEKNPTAKSEKGVSRKKSTAKRSKKKKTRAKK